MFYSIPPRVRLIKFAAAVREFSGRGIRAVCFDMRNCCLGEMGLLIHVIANWEQSKPIRNPAEAGFSERKVAFSMSRWVPATAPAIPALVRRFAANSRSDSALFCKNHGHMRKSWNIFLGPAFFVTVVGRGGRPHARRLG
jgi:hypothetical protein